MDKEAIKEIKYLKLYSGFLTLAIVSFVIMSFARPGGKHFKEITAQRINIVGPKGNLRMVISNSKLQSPGRVGGKKMPPRKRPQGIIFFNHKGTEVGGLIYDVRGLVFSVDQYKKDQIMQLQYGQSKNGQKHYGLQLWARPGNITASRAFSIYDSLEALHYSRKKIMKTLREMNGGLPYVVPRMFVGYNRKHQVGLFIQGKKGKNRIEIYVNKQNKIQIKFLDKMEIPFQ